MNDPKQGLPRGRAGGRGLVNIEARLGPAMGALHGLAHLFLRGPVGDALVEAHGDVRAQALLVGRGQLGGEIVRAAVDVRAEPDAVVGYFPQRSHAESLEPAAVGEYGPVPAHEPMQASHLAHGPHAGPQVQVISIAQDDLGPGRPHLFGSQPFDRGLGGHRHEERRERFAVGRLKLAGPGAAVSME